MIAVTIGVGKYARMARLAAGALARHTGLPTRIIGDAEFAASGLRAPHHLKFRLFDLVSSENILFFDADLVALNPWNPLVYADCPAIVAVRDRMAGDIREDAAEW